MNKLCVQKFFFSTHIGGNTLLIVKQNNSISHQFLFIVFWVPHQSYLIKNVRPKKKKRL